MFLSICKALLKKRLSSASQKFVEMLQTKKKSVVERTITEEDVRAFTCLTGDHNALHKGSGAIVHGAFLNALVSAVIGTRLPGCGTMVVSQTLNYPNACPVGESVIITVEITAPRKIISCTYNIRKKQDDTVVLQGEAKLFLKRSVHGEIN